MQKYDITDPAQNLMLQNIAPELFSRREEVIDQTQALVSAYAKTRLRGAKNLSDLELEWLIETGRLELPEGPIWSPVRWRNAQRKNLPDAAWNASRYRFGLFSPMQWLTKADAGNEPRPSNPADIRGGNTKYLNSRVPYPNAGWANEWGYPIPYAYAGSNTHDSRVVSRTTSTDAQKIARGRADASGTHIVDADRRYSPEAVPLE
jgi:hypothetical protein